MAQGGPKVSCQIPHYSPTCAQGGVMEEHIDRCRRYDIRVFITMCVYLFEIQVFEVVKPTFS